VAASVTIDALVTLTRGITVNQKRMTFHATLGDDGAILASVCGHGPDTRCVPYAVSPEQMWSLFNAILELVDGTPDPDSGDSTTAHHESGRRGAPPVPGSFAEAD
jgi:hypothetical protein